MKTQLVRAYNTLMYAFLRGGFVMGVIVINGWRGVYSIMTAKMVKPSFW
jgi:hypothetical protein